MKLKEKETWNINGGGKASSGDWEIEKRRKKKREEEEEEIHRLNLRRVKLIEDDSTYLLLNFAAFDSFTLLRLPKGKGKEHVSSTL